MVRERELIVGKGKSAAGTTAGKSSAVVLNFRGKYPTQSLGNAINILLKDERWRGVFAFDEQCLRVRVNASLPPGAHGPWPLSGGLGRPLGDSEIAQTAIWCEQHYKIPFPLAVMAEAIAEVAKFTPTYPIRDYLKSLEWDGEKRVDDWLNTYMKVEDDAPYVKEIASKWLISGVARAYDPGCQVDYMLVLEGGQRCGKSTAFESLVPNREWYCSTRIDLSNKDAYQVIAGRWIVMFDELDSLSKAEDTRSKNFITQRVDTYCKRYGREPIDQKRSCILAGATNEEQYLKDATGGGRYWPVHTSATEFDRIDAEAIAAVRDQLWAEAKVRYQGGEKWHMTDHAIILSAREEQESRRQQDPWEHTIAPLALKKDIKENGISLVELLEIIGFSPGQIKTSDSQRMAKVLRALGWSKASKLKHISKYRRSNIYLPPPVGNP